jgi:ATP-dependent Zn protease
MKPNLSDMLIIEKLVKKDLKNTSLNNNNKNIVFFNFLFILFIIFFILFLIFRYLEKKKNSNI